MAELPVVIEILPAATKQLERLPTRIRRNIAGRIDDLARDPQPQMAKPLKGGQKLWRLRVGDYRVIYSHDATRVLIVDVGHRKDVYRGL